ncbi:MAG: fumarylacetoacetate hydrolase family protein [Minicystis sp.]
MRRSGWIAALAAAMTIAGAGPAIGQTKSAPSASASAAPSAQPKDAKKEAPASTGSMPAGHPPVGNGMPAGHPSVDGDPGDEVAPQGHGARGADPRFFTPPQDVAIDDGALPAGTIVVMIKDAQDRPIPRAPITLGILHSTVAKGESRERKSAVADEAGEARFDNLSFGSGHSYEITTTRGPARYGHPPVGLGDKSGKRVVVHAYETASRIEDLAVAMQGLVFVALKEDAIQVEQLISVYNLGPISWMADTTFELPKGFKAFNKQEAGGDARIDEVPGKGAALRGTFPPGRTDIDFRYQIPLDNEERQTLKLQLPPRVAQARVLAESSKTMALGVAGFPDAQRTQGRDGKRLLITEHQATRAEGGIPALEITLSGLPTPGPGRWVAVLLAVAALAAGFLYFRDHGSETIDEDARQDLDRSPRGAPRRAGGAGARAQDGRDRQEDLRSHPRLAHGRAGAHREHARGSEARARRPEGPASREGGAGDVTTMKRYGRFALADGRRVFAEIEGGRARVLDGAPWAGGALTSEMIEGIDDEGRGDRATRLAPVAPAKILCVGRNYKAHATELGNEVPPEPLLFLKPSSSLLDPEGTIELPPTSIAARIDHEAELAVVIGRRARRVSVDEAAASIFGCTLAGDITARDLQKKDGQWTRAKGMDGFCPVGPVIVTGLDPQALSITCRVNGEVRQSGVTSDMFFSIAHVIAYASQVMTLEPGDLLLTGTPPGVGPLKGGDVLEIEVPGIGTLRAHVSAPA